MPALLLYHRFKGLDEGWREKSRSLRQRKQAESEEGVDALAKNLETVDLDRFPQQRVFDGHGIAEHPQAGVALGLHRDVPDRQADEPVARLGLEARPIDDRWSVGVVGLDQHSAEGPLVTLAAENDRPSFAGFPYPGGAVGRPDHR